MGINSMNLIYHLISKLKNNYTRSAEASCAQSPSKSLIIAAVVTGILALFLTIWLMSWQPLKVSLLPRKPAENNVPLQQPAPQTEVENTNIMAQAPEKKISTSENRPPPQITPQQQAEIDLNRIKQMLLAGNNADATLKLVEILKYDPSHVEARKLLVSLLLEQKRNSEAENILKQGLLLNPQQSGFALLLARLQVDRNDLTSALETLLLTRPYAEKQADYESFVAALLQRQSRHKEAIVHYQAALQSKPNEGAWLLGLGISLRAENRKEEAKVTFKQALDSNTLNPDLRKYVIQQLKELQIS
jgi:MSHA biogenesis protein MshN